MQMFFQQRVLLFTVSMTFSVCVLQIPTLDPEIVES